MLMLFRRVLSAGRKRRRFAAGFAIRLLRLLRDIEKDEACRFSDKLDEFTSDYIDISKRDYIEIEEFYTECECTLGFLESAIEDLEFAY